MALDKVKTDVIADNAVTSAKLPDGGVSIDDLATNTGITSTYHKVPVFANDAARDHNTTGIPSPAVGMIIYNTAVGALQQYNGSWSAIEPSPVLTSISPVEVESAAGGDVVITLTGSNFKDSAMTVTFLATSGADITSGIVVGHTSSTTVTATLAKNLFVDAREPYSVKVSTAGGISSQLDDVVRVDNSPSWSTYVGTLSGTPPVVAAINDNIATATHATLSATDPESDTIAYSETTSVLTNAGMSLNGTTGAITGTPTGVGSNTNYDFTARATSTGDGGASVKTTDQAFRFTINDFIPPAVFAGMQYTGNETNARGMTFNETADFRPDILWIKQRTGTGATGNWWMNVDSVRGYNKMLAFNDAANEDVPGTTALASFDADGFTLQAPVRANKNSSDFSAFGFKAGGAPSGNFPASLTDGIGNGTLNSSSMGWGNKSGMGTIIQSVNQNTGISITQYTAQNTNNSYFPHQLGATPDFVIIKKITGTGTQNWMTWHSKMGLPQASGGNDFWLLLNSTADKADSGGTAYFGTTGMTSTKIGVSSQNIVGGSADYICYAFKSVEGGSAFGFHDGNISSVTGTTVGTGGYCGFKPRFVMIKIWDATSGDITGSWVIYDAFSGASANSSDDYLKANAGEGEISNAARTVNFVSNGFTMDSYGDTGQSGYQYITAAFA